jgi:hypothetical protein
MAKMLSFVLSNCLLLFYILYYSIDYEYLSIETFQQKSALLIGDKSMLGEFIFPSCSITAPSSHKGITMLFVRFIPN